jgi:hypothetical protein
VVTFLYEEKTLNCKESIQSSTRGPEASGLRLKDDDGKIKEAFVTGTIT